VHRKTFTAPLPFPAGAHVLRHTVDAKPYLYFCDPYPLVRVRATVEALSSPESYEAFTPLDTGELDPAAAPARDASGKALWAWKRGTARLTATRHAEWARRGELAASEQLLTLRDVDSGQAVLAHRGTVAWNAYRGRYVMIVCESFGSSLVGELWYAEADGPLGPWLYARKIGTHDRYSFYNPRHHPFFDQDGGRLIYFEGTYTRSFSGNPVVTPRYDYNQVMYRLDLDDPRLNLPVAVYRETSSGRATFLLGPGASTAGLPIAFWALERPAAGARAVSLGRGAPSIYAPSACAPGVTTLRPLLERRSGPSAEPTYELGASPTAKTTEGRAPIGFAWPHSGRPARLAGH
jgi:hypothetical protein